MRVKRTFGRLFFDPAKRQWVIDGVEPHVSLRIKDIFRRIWIGASGEFRFQDDDLHAHELLWFMDRHPLVVSKFDLKRLRQGRKRFEAGVEEIEQILSPDFKAREYAGLRPGCELWPYQAQAVEVYLRKRRLLLADDVGLGKTNTAIGCLVADPSALPAAVIVQAHLPEQWQERIEEFSNLKVHIIKTVAPYKLPEADVYIFSFGKLGGWVDHVRDGHFKTVVIDEPQELRGGETTVKGAGAKAICSSAVGVIGLSATPIMNYGVEMWHVMQFIAPGLLGSLEEFLREWCNGDKIVKDPDALGSYLREQHAMLRRTEDDVGHQMPKPNVTRHEVPFDYNEARKSEDVAVMLAIKGTSGSFMERGRALRELDILQRQITGVAKARGVADYVRILLDADLPVLLAGWHREVYDLWNEELAAYNPVMYTGTERRTQKRAAKEAFVSGRTNLMMISLRSGAGLDGLQHRCRDVVIGELDWSPNIHKQLIGRVRRTGQTGTVNAHFLVTDGGSDPLIAEINGLKASQSHGILDPFKNPEAPVNDEGRMKRLAEMVLARRAVEAATGVAA